MLKNDIVASHVVRVREMQEYDIEVITTGSSRQAVKLARKKFLDMTVDEQATNSVGVMSRSFEVGEEYFDDDDLA